MAFRAPSGAGYPDHQASEPPPMRQPLARLKHQLSAAFSAPGSDALIGGPMGFVPRGARMAYQDIKGLMNAADSGIVEEASLMSHPELLQQAPTEGPVSPFSALAKDLANPKAYEGLDRHANDVSKMDANLSMGRTQFDPAIWDDAGSQAFHAANPIEQRAEQGASLMRRYTNRER